MKKTCRFTRTFMIWNCMSFKVKWRWKSLRQQTMYLCTLKSGIIFSSRRKKIGLGMKKQYFRTFMYLIPEWSRLKLCFWKRLIKPMTWQANSADLNSVENFRLKFKRMVNEKVSTNNEDLLKVIQESWNQFNEEYCVRLVKSMPKRTIFDVKASREATRYSLDECMPVTDESSSGVMAKVPDCDLKVSRFKLHSRYYV